MVYSKGEENPSGREYKNWYCHLGCMCPHSALHLSLNQDCGWVFVTHTAEWTDRTETKQYQTVKNVVAKVRECGITMEEFMMVSYGQLCNFSVQLQMSICNH